MVELAARAFQAQWCRDLSQIHEDQILRKLANMITKMKIAFPIKYFFEIRLVLKKETKIIQEK